MQITQADVGFAIFMVSIMILSFYAGYYSGLKQAKEAIRYARSVVRASQTKN
jgi:hypothetical protein